jgi:hypothetical protein
VGFGWRLRGFVGGEPSRGSFLDSAVEMAALWDVVQASSLNFCFAGSGSRISIATIFSPIYIIYARKYLREISVRRENRGGKCNENPQSIFRASQLAETNTFASRSPSPHTHTTTPPFSQTLK